jgi:hypothetical protein
MERVRTTPEPLSIVMEEVLSNADCSVCGLCGNHFHLNNPQAVLKDSHKDVCDSCLQTYAPELYAELKRQ